MDTITLTPDTSAACEQDTATPAAPAHTMTVFKYAVLKEDLPPEIVAEIRRAHDLRNQLVEVERRNADRIAAAWAEHPEIAQANEALAAAEAHLEEVLKAAAAERSRAGKRSVSRETADAVKAARAARKAAKEHVKDLKTRLYPLVKQRVQAVRDQRRAEIKALYAEFVAAGLYWATYNEVVASHETAAKLINKQRKEGRPAQFRFHRWDGSGTIAVQLQRGAGQPPRSPQTLAAEDGNKWRNVAMLQPWVTPEEWAAMSQPERRRRAREGRVRLRIGSGEHARLVELPVVIHRPMPPEADVTQVLLTRKRVAGRWEASISVVARVPAPTPRTEGTLVAVHGGWRALGDGAIRSAVIWGPPAGMPRGHGVEPWLRHHGQWAEVVVPEQWQERWERLDGVRAQRDRNLDALKAWLGERMAAHEWLRDALDPEGTLSRWRSPGRFAALALRLRDAEPPAGGDAEVWREVASYLEAWRKQDKHLWEWLANGRRKLIAQRKDAYRVIAAWLLEEAAVVAVDAWDLQSAARAPRVEDDDDHQQVAARRNQQAASPGLLRDALIAGAKARGVHVHEEEGKVSGIHHGCGGVLGVDERRASIMVECSACRRMVDQDVSAARVLADAARG